MAIWKSSQVASFVSGNLFYTRAVCPLYKDDHTPQGIRRTLLRMTPPPSAPSQKNDEGSYRVEVDSLAEMHTEKQSTDRCQQNQGADCRF